MGTQLGDHGNLDHRKGRQNLVSDSKLAFSLGMKSVAAEGLMGSRKIIDLLNGRLMKLRFE